MQLKTKQLGYTQTLSPSLSLSLSLSLHRVDREKQFELLQSSWPITGTSIDEVTKQVALVPLWTEQLFHCVFCSFVSFLIVSLDRTRKNYQTKWIPLCSLASALVKPKIKAILSIFGEMWRNRACTPVVFRMKLLSSFPACSDSVHHQTKQKKLEASTPSLERSVHFSEGSSLTVWIWGPCILTYKVL